MSRNYLNDIDENKTNNEDDDLYGDFNYNIEIGGTPPGTAAIGGKQPTVLPSYIETKDNDEFLRMATAARPVVSEDARPMTSGIFCFYFLLVPSSAFKKNLLSFFLDDEQKHHHTTFIRSARSWIQSSRRFHKTADIRSFQPRI